MCPVRTTAVVALCLLLTSCSRPALEPSTAPALPPIVSEMIRGATSAAAKTARIWDTAAAVERYGVPVHALYAISPNGKIIAKSPWVETEPCIYLSIELWNAVTGERLHTMSSNDDTTCAMAFSPDSTILVTAGIKTGIIDGGLVQPGLTDGIGEVRFWDVATGRQLRMLAGVGAVYDVAFSPDGKTLLTTEDYGPLRVWDTVTGRELHRLAALNEEYSYSNTCGTGVGASFSADGKTILAVRSDCRTTFWDAVTGEELPGSGSTTPAEAP
jgi:WD40 repeat protein